MTGTDLIARREARCRDHWDSIIGDLDEGMVIGGKANGGSRFIDARRGSL